MGHVQGNQHVPAPWIQDSRRSRDPRNIIGERVVGLRRNHASTATSQLNEIGALTQQVNRLVVSAKDWQC